jgi:ubiquitin-like domain-containing CTD phosphatase 1
MWLETKLVEIGMIGGDRPYKVCFVSDASTMFPVSKRISLGDALDPVKATGRQGNRAHAKIFSQRNGQAVKHHVKPLEYFWATQPQWSVVSSWCFQRMQRS